MEDPGSKLASKLLRTLTAVIPMFTHLLHVWGRQYGSFSPAPCSTRPLLTGRSQLPRFSGNETPIPPRVWRVKKQGPRKNRMPSPQNCNKCKTNDMTAVSVRSSFDWGFQAPFTSFLFFDSFCFTYLFFWWGFGASGSGVRGFARGFWRWQCDLGFWG